MFTQTDMAALVQARPFAPFRLVMSDGGAVEVRTPEQVLIGRRYAVVGLLDPAAADASFDRHATVWYMHVTRTEMLAAGPPPFAAPPPADSGSPAPAAP